MNYGLPYKGSKNSIATQIVDILPAGKSFCDCCCGGGAVVQAAVLSGKFQSVTGYDINKSIIGLLRATMIENRSDWKRPAISKKEFYDSRDRDADIDDWAARYIASFGYNGQEYLWSEERTPVKSMLHDMIMAEDYRTRRAIFRDFLNMVIKGKFSTADLKNLTHMEQIQNIERFQEVAECMATRKTGTKLAFVTASMFDIPFEKYDVLYFDPPYRGTKGYNGKPFSQIMFTTLLKTLKEAGKQVFVSEYNCPADGFTEVWSVEKMMTQDANKNTRVEEKIFYGGTKEEYERLPGTLAQSNTGNDTTVHNDTDGRAESDSTGEPDTENGSEEPPSDD